MVRARKRGPAWRGWAERFARINGWLERYLDIDEAVHWMGHHGKTAALAVLILLLAAWSASGLDPGGPGRDGPGAPLRPAAARLTWARVSTLLLALAHR